MWIKLNLRINTIQAWFKLHTMYTTMPNITIMIMKILS